MVATDSHLNQEWIHKCIVSTTYIHMYASHIYTDTTHSIIYLTTYLLYAGVSGYLPKKYLW